MTKTYRGTKKSNWLKCLKVYYSLYRTCSKDNYLLNNLNQITNPSCRATKPISR